MGRTRIYGKQISLSCTPEDEKALKRWARIDGMTVSKLFAEIVNRERLHRAGVTQTVIVDRAEYDRAVSRGR
jgi:hypothetical protein